MALYFRAEIDRGVKIIDALKAPEIFKIVRPNERTAKLRKIINENIGRVLPDSEKNLVLIKTYDARLSRKHLVFNAAVMSAFNGLDCVTLYLNYSLTSPRVESASRNVQEKSAECFNDTDFIKTLIEDSPDFSKSRNLSGSSLDSNLISVELIRRRPNRSLSIEGYFYARNLYHYNLEIEEENYKWKKKRLTFQEFQSSN